MNKPVIIDGVNVSECCYCVASEHRKDYINKFGCFACKESLTPYILCEDNPNCYFKQLQRLKSEFSEVLDAKCGTIAALKVENDELKKEIMLIRNGYDEEDCTLTCPSLQAYKQSAEEGQEIIAELKAKLERIKNLANDRLSLCEDCEGNIKSGKCDEPCTAYFFKKELK